jgi:DNA (cytosine-5)-methyltransferase 1
MSRGAYYNEIEPYAAEWLRNLIKKGLIADGEVDERSIVDVRSAELSGFRQCHFFAGIGVWSYALRLAGWPDDREVWTGSCPCQPFSAAGKRQGTADERHLWPEFYRLISERRPAVVFGEQVASADGLAWFDTVSADMEGAGYAIGAADLCAAGVGAPHIRQRLWFVGERMADTSSGRGGAGLCHSGQTGERRDQLADGLGAHRVAHPAGEGLEVGSLSGVGRGDVWQGGKTAAAHELPGRMADPELHQQWPGGGSGCEDPARHESGLEPGGCGAPCGLANAEHDGGRTNLKGRGQKGRAADGRRGSACGLANHISDGRGESGHGYHAGHDRPQLDANGRDDRPGPTNGHWRAADWLHCRDGKWRPVEPGTFPLAHGIASRVGQLRAYGNAISPYPAAEMITAFMGARP